MWMQGSSPKFAKESSKALNQETIMAMELVCYSN